MNLSIYLFLFECGGLISKKQGYAKIKLPRFTPPHSARLFENQLMVPQTFLTFSPSPIRRCYNA